MHRIVGPLALLEVAMMAGLTLLLAVRHRSAVRQPLHRVEIDHVGPRYVFLHGLGATHRYWLRQLEATAPPGRILLIDLMGFGDSPKPWFRHRVDRHLERLHAIIGTERNQTLVGHSLGAALALAYAARYPDRVGRLVLLSLPYFGSEAAAYRWLRQTAEGWLFTNVVLMTLACIITRRVAARFLPYLRPDLPREVAEDAVKHSWMASTTSLWDVVYRHDFRKDADAIGDRIPVLCIHGSRDMTVPADSVSRLAAGRSSWTMLTLPATDHHPWLREPDLCHDLVFGASVEAVDLHEGLPSVSCARVPPAGAPCGGAARPSPSRYVGFSRSS